MRYFWLALLLIAAAPVELAAQASTSPQPQSARQALIEMFMGKGADDFVKHLPDAARQKLIRKGETPANSVALRISSIGREAVGGGEHIETFDAGPNILTSERPESHERLEVTVEHDSLLGEQDEIELSVHMYKDGQPQSLPIVPSLTFLMKQEKDIWKLMEVTVAGRIPLTDADYLDGLRKEEDSSNEASAQFRLSMIDNSEKTFAANHADVGYTCSLETLFPAPESAEASVYNPSTPNQEWKGYKFTLSGCAGTPATRFRVLAVPIDPESQMKTFCADQSGTVKFLPAGEKSNCFRRGQPAGSNSTTSSSD
jgi:hypothetical protein